MAKKGEKKKKPFNPDAQGLFLIVLGFLGFLALLSFSFLEPKANWLGYVGYIAALGGEYAFGLGAYLIPCYSIWLGVRLLKEKKLTQLGYDHLYFLILLGSVCLLLNIFAEKFPEKARFFDGRVVSETLSMYSPYQRILIRYNLGGIPFYFLFSDLPGINLQRILSPVGTTLIFSCLGLVSLLLLTRMRVVSNARAFWQGMIALGSALKKGIFALFSFFKKQPASVSPPPRVLHPVANGKMYSGLPASGLKINLPNEKVTAAAAPVEILPKKKLTEILKPEKKAEPKSEAVKPQAESKLEPKKVLPKQDAVSAFVKQPVKEPAPAVPTKS